MLYSETYKLMLISVYSFWHNIQITKQAETAENFYTMVDHCLKSIIGKAELRYGDKKADLNNTHDVRTISSVISMVPCEKEYIP